MSVQTMSFAGTSMVKGEGHTKGAVRVLTAKDGGKFTEELVAYDARVRYQTRAARGNAKRALTLLDKLDRAD